MNDVEIYPAPFTALWAKAAPGLRRLSLLGGLALAVSSVAAQLPRLGSETLAHAASGDNEHEVFPAVDQNGNYVVAWSGLDAGGNLSGVYARRFSRAGVPLGAAFQPHNSNTGIQKNAAVSMADDGRFVIVWESNAARGGNDADVFYRLYDANGNPTGSTAAADLRANVTATGVRELPRVSMNRSTGEFVIAWAGGATQAAVEPYYRRFNATGAALDAGDVPANSVAAVNLNYTPTVAFSTNGTFVIAWEGNPNNDAVYEVLYRRYTFSTGAALDASNRQANSLAGQDPTNVDVAIENDGQFVIAWTKVLTFSGTDTSDLLVRRFGANGDPLAAEVAFETAASGGSDLVPRSRIAMENDGDFVIVWNNSGGHVSNNETYIRFYNADGTAKAAEALISTTAGVQTRPRVAVNPAGTRCIAVYSGAGPSDSNAAMFQRYATANAAPTLSAIGNKSVAELATLSFTASASETAANFGDTITYSLDAGFPAGATINSSTGAFSWTPTEAQGPSAPTITIRATDDGEPALSDFETITVTVSETNQNPTGLGLAGGTIAENSPGGSTVGTLSASDADLPAQTLTYTLVAGTGSADNGSFTISGTSLNLTGVADFETKSSYAVRVQVADGAGGTAQQAFTVTVTNVDDTAPASNASVLDATLAGTNQIVVNFSAADVESSGLASTALYVRAPGEGTYSVTGTPQAGASGSFNYTAAADGVYRFYTRSTDNSSNVEAAPGSPDVTVTINIEANSNLALTAASASETLVFPMTSALNATLVLTGATAGDIFNVSRTTPLGGSQPAYFKQAGLLINEALSVGHTGVGTFTAELQWAYDPASDDGLGAAPLNTVFKFSGGESPESTFTVTPAGGVLTIPGLTSFSTFYAGNSAAVPVSLSGFAVE